MAPYNLSWSDRRSRCDHSYSFPSGVEKIRCMDDSRVTGFLPSPYSKFKPCTPYLFVCFQHLSFLKLQSSTHRVLHRPILLCCLVDTRKLRCKILDILPRAFSSCSRRTNFMTRQVTRRNRYCLVNVSSGEDGRRGRKEGSETTILPARVVMAMKVGKGKRNEENKGR